MQSSIAILLAGLTRLGGLTSRPAVSFALSLACLLAISTGSAANSQGMSVFDRPAILVQQLEALADMGQGRINKAASAVEKLLADYPSVPENHLVAAILYGRQGNTDAARTAMEAAVDRGLTPFQVSEQAAALVQLGGDQWYRALLRRAEERAPSITRAPDPAPVQGQEAIVAEDNTVWDPDALALRPAFTFPSPAFAARNPAASDDEAGRLLNDLVRTGQAAGNLGDLYVNLDRNHSRLRMKAFPQLSFVGFGDAARTRNLDFGLNIAWMFDGPAFGNASVGVKGMHSLARYALQDARVTQQLYRQYRSNQIFVYPAVRDYAPWKIDRFTANTPYVVVTEGKSGSDRPVLEAIANALAALRPDVKQTLVEKGLVAPVLQMLLRRARLADDSVDAYLSAAAHPPVIDGTSIDRLRLIRLANAITVDTIPPYLEIELSGAAGDSQGLFATPAAVSRIVSPGAGAPASVRVQTRLVETGPAGSAEIRWVIVEGDPGKIRIEQTGNPLGGEYAITIAPHDRRTSLSGRDVQTDRVDIAGFAVSGDAVSPPVFINLYYPREN